MRIDKNSRLNCIGLMLAWTLGGCSGGDPAQSPTPTPAVSLSPSVAASPATTASPSDEFTPAPGVSPLGGKPLSEEEKEYQLKLKKAEEFTLSRNYEEGIPLLEELHEENPKELATLFYLLLSYGTNEDIPVKDSKAYNYAQKILTLDPNSREAAKARSYVNSANLVLPPGFKYGKDTVGLLGGWVVDPEGIYKAKTDIPFHSSIQARLGSDDQTTLWETEASPSTSTGPETLPKGTEVKVLSIKEFFYSLTSWKKALKGKPDLFDKSMFDVAAMYVEVVSEGPLKEKKGWIVNHAERFVNAEGDEQWGVWISNRLDVPREAELVSETPAP